MQAKVFKMKLTETQKLKYCNTGCRQHFYNCREGEAKCMHLPSAQLCIKAVYGSRDQVKPDMVKTLTCFSQQL